MSGDTMDKVLKSMYVIQYIKHGDSLLYLHTTLIEVGKPICQPRLLRYSYTRSHLARSYISPPCPAIVPCFSISTLTSNYIR